MNPNGHPSTLIPNAAGKVTSPTRELRDMQRVAYKLIMDGEAKASDVAQLMRAHVAAGQHRCELLMRAKPKPVDISTLPKRGSKAKPAISEE